MPVPQEFENIRLYLIYLQSAVTVFVGWVEVTKTQHPKTLNNPSSLMRLSSRWGEMDGLIYSFVGFVIAEKKPQNRERAR